MWPWGHLAFAYLLYSSFSRLWYRRAPAWPGVVLVAFGSQAPDLIDKPLAWTVNILPSGRSLAHSLIFGTLIVLLVAAVLRWADIPGRAAFALGYYSHLVSDGYRAVLGGDYHDLSYLLWPLIPQSPPDEPTVGILQYLLEIQLNGQVVFELGLAGVVVCWWLLDGAPGVTALWHVVRRRIQRPAN